MLPLGKIVSCEVSSLRVLSLKYATPFKFQCRFFADGSTYQRLEQLNSELMYLKEASKKAEVQLNNDVQQTRFRSSPKFLKYFKMPTWKDTATLLLGGCVLTLAWSRVLEKNEHEEQFDKLKRDLEAAQQQHFQLQHLKPELDQQHETLKQNVVAVAQQQAPKNPLLVEKLTNVLMEHKKHVDNVFESLDTNTRKQREKNQIISVDAESIKL